jgi:xanthine dehydrogenase accessory factor
MVAEEPGVVTELTTCASEGGLDVFVEPKLPAARLLVAGSSPAARALAALAGALGEHVTAVVDQAHETLPGADTTVAVDALASAGLQESDAVVVATMNRYDETALRAALATSAGYVGLIASRRRGRKTLALLAEEGVPAADLERVTTPAGLDLGPSTQEEIALAVLAEIVAWRHQRTAPGDPIPAGGRPPATATATPSSTRSAPPETATDPVCGMAVAVTPAAVTTEVDGERYWFCGPGCRDAFLAGPGRFAGTAAPRG